jgi:ankyrin repeat protein
MPGQRSLRDVLQSVSDILFPTELGETVVSIESASPDGDTALHILLWRRDFDGALLLIESGANVNAIGDMGETPLHVAVRQGNMHVVTALLRSGARTDIVSEFGQSPLDLSKELGVEINHV